VGNALFVGGFEGLAGDQVHDQSVAFEAVDLGDVGMVEGGQDFGFAFEAGEAVAVVGHAGREDFDGDLAVELRVAALIHFAHAGGA